MRKALVLSGGGGRGAYHVGVIEALVKLGWMEDGQGPDIIAGTSIGSTNGAALASGLTVAQLKERWLEMHTEDVHRLSSDLPSYMQPMLRFMLRSVLTSDEHGGRGMPSEAEDEDAIDDVDAPGMFGRFKSFFNARPFRSLLDTAPWRRTLAPWMNWERINSPQSPAFLVTTTDLQCGDLRLFINHDIKGNPIDRLTLDHIMASSSIPVVYPWTKLDGHLYWDGAVISNTPLGPVISMAPEEDMDIVVVMMTPWSEEGHTADEELLDPPQDIVQSLTLALDWAMLASYRQAFRIMRRYNQLAEAAEKLNRAADITGDESFRMTGVLPRRIAEPTVISPEHLMPMEWIVDYESERHEQLFEMGYRDTLRAFALRPPLH